MPTALSLYAAEHKLIHDLAEANVIVGNKLSAGRKVYARRHRAGLCGCPANARRVQRECEGKNGSGGAGQRSLN